MQKRILEAFSRCGSISRAVKVGGSCRATHYKALKHSPRYRAAFEQAQETFADHLRQAACHRAIRGVPRLKFYKGRVIKAPVLDKQGRPLLDDQGEPVLQPYVEYEYSDALLIRLLQARCPEFKKTTRLQNAGLSGGRFPQVDARKQYSTDLIRRFSAENLKPEAP
ncbi:MAG: hypothetical protein R3C45_09010 [Phycisphaerales bacterium]